MTKRIVVAVVCLSLCFMLKTSLLAQGYVYTTGDAPFSTQIPIENGFINVNNGDIHIEIPLATQAQRGGHLQLNERLVYDSRIWKIVQNSGYTWQPTNVPNSMGGWTFQSGQGTGTLSIFSEGSKNVRCDDNANGRPVTYEGAAWTDPSGTYHRFNTQWLAYPKICDDGSGDTEQTGGAAIDASGYTIQLSGSMYGAPQTVQIFDRFGNQVYPRLQDTNGNTMSADSNGNLVDTFGRTPVLTTTSGNTIYYDVLGFSGTRQRYTVTTETILYKTAFAETSVTDVSGSFTAIQSIKLPDGSSYSFTYDSGTASGNYGELTGVTLPTGGTISYGYINFLDSYQNENRWVHTRLKDGGTTTFTPATISNCTSSAGCQEKTTVTSPQGSDTIYTFTLDQGSYANAASWNTGIDAYQGSAASGKKLKSVTTSYGYTTGSMMVTPTGSTSYLTPSTTTTVTTLPDVGLASQTLTTLDAQGVNATVVKQWDYYSGTAPSSPLQETDYTYGCGIPQSTIVKDGAGHQLSSLSYGFDETTPKATSGLQNHTSGSNSCNVTSVHSGVSAAGPTTTQAMAYDDAGVVLSSTDGNGNTTSLGHDSNDLCTTSTTRPTTNSVQHISSATCDASTGLLTSQTDENSKTTKYSSYDALNRLLQVNYPDGGLATFSYPSSTESIESHALTSSVSSKTTTTFDSYGRKSHVTVADPEGDDTVDYAYDTSGRLLSQSNPHRSSAATTDGTTTFGYDALGRLTLQTQPDASTKTWTYLGNTVTAKDEAGNQWKQTSDGFGRLTQVLEPSKTSQSPTVETDYAYNVFTTTVTQRGVSGESAHIRTFVTDSLGRPFTTTTPEAGVICYGTVSSGTCQSGGYDAAGNLTSKTDARGVKLSWSYDALNRPISETSSDNSISNSYSYDNTTVGSSGIGRLFGAFGSKASTGFYYDSMGRITGKSYFTPSTNAWFQAFSAIYDLAGDITSLTYPDGRVVTQAWDNAGHQVSSVYSSYSGQAVNYSYLSSATYLPTGSPQTMTFGNGTVQTLTSNNRLQPAEITLQANTDGLSQKLMDKIFCYGPSTASCTSMGSGKNNGNILAIPDALKSGVSQAFTYDNLNRLTAFASGDQTMSQTYAYDSFGNMNQVAPGTSQSNFSFNANNRISSLGFVYDASGNLTQSTVGAGVNQYMAYDAEGKLVNYNNGAATYTYDATSNRVRKDVGSTWTEYLSFNGQAVAEKNSDGSWSDYIYANGQQIARADTFDRRIHIHGTTGSAGGADAWDLPIAGYTIPASETLCWRQYQAGSQGGIGLQFTDGSSTNWTTTDSDGQVMNSDTTENSWHSRCVNLSAFAGKTLSAGWINSDYQTPSGSWNAWFSDIAFIGSDGSINPVYDRQSSINLSEWTLGAMSNTGMVFESSNSAADASLPLTTTSYYYGDSIGSTRLVAGAEGWPLAAHTYYPFGLEQSTTTDPNHYKYTGLERDAESGFDHATFRTLANLQGRWSSPDPYDGSYDPSNPQSFNRYAYVLNNPLSLTDPLGLATRGDGGAGECDWCDAFGQLIVQGFESLFDLFGHSSFHGSLTPRPTTGSLGDGSFDQYGVFHPDNPYTLQVTSWDATTSARLSFSALTAAANSFKLQNSKSTVRLLLPGMNYCGPGYAGGTPTSGVDTACFHHDLCYEDAGVGAASNVLATIRIGSQSTKSAIAACNAQLCSELSGTLAYTPNEVGAVSVAQIAFGCH